MQKLFLVLVCFLSIIAVSAKSFGDVPADALERAAIDRLSNTGIINGYSDGTFGGLNNVTRAELAKIFLVAANQSIRTDGFSRNFADVQTDDWFYDYVHTAAEQGIVAGYPDGNFRPLAPVNTAEFLKMLVQTFDLPKNQGYTYGDVSESDWFAPYAGVSQSQNLFPLRVSDQLEPARLMTRYEVVYALDQILFPRRISGQNNLSKNTSGLSTELSYQPLAQTTSTTRCTVQSSQLCIEDKTRFQELTVSPGMTDVRVAQYQLFSPESTGRFASFEILTNAQPNAYPVFWVEQNGQRLSPKTALSGDQLELSMDTRFTLGNNKSLTLKMDIPATMQSSDFIRVRLLYLDNVWQNQTGDIGTNSAFSGKIIVQ